MRICTLLAVTLGWLLLGATCIPLIQLPPDEAQPGTTLGVAIQLPSADNTVPQGTVIDIQWAGFNSTGTAATAHLLVESRADLTQTLLTDEITIDGRLSTTTQWDTTGFQRGEYVIYARISTADTTQTATGEGHITIDAQPTFAFTEPTQDATYDGSSDLTIGWEGFDPEGSGRITLALDADTDHESGNEVFIHEDTLTEASQTGSFDWNGEDQTGDTVSAGTYHLYAVVADDVNDDQTIDAGVQITVSDASGNGDGPLTLGIVRPEEDTTFLASAASFEIEFSVNEFDDALIDLKIDTDDDHANGNEATILSQRLVTGGTQADTFDWDGTYADGTAVPDGIYRLFILMNTGGSAPETAEGPGLVFRRTTEDQPLVGLLEPGDAQTVQAGGTLVIRWRDDDPGETATIRLAIDDDPRPGENESESEDDIAEIDIVVDREAAADGDLQDSYVWQVPGPATLAPGTYYIFAYIIANPADPPPQPPVEQSSVAPAPVIIEDPANP